MKRNINTGELIINYLASCQKEEVDTRALIKAVDPDCSNEEDMDKAFNTIMPVLTNLQTGGLVKLSTESLSETIFVPRVIHIMPKMKKTADRLMQDKAGGAKDGLKAKGRPQTKAAAKGGGSKRRQDAVDEMHLLFADLFEKKGRLVRIRGEWQRLIASMCYQDIEEETGFDACTRSFVNGLIWQNRREGILPRREAAGKPEKADPSLRPEFKKLIDEIVKADEDKNGALKEGSKYRGNPGDADASLLRLDRDEISDFMRCIHQMRDGIHPGRLWRDAISKFVTETLQYMPVYEACMRCFRAGILFQMNRIKLEGTD